MTPTLYTTDIYYRNTLRSDVINAIHSIEPDERDLCIIMDALDCDSDLHDEVVEVVNDYLDASGYNTLSEVPFYV